jgi:hypothetical protein
VSTTFFDIETGPLDEEKIQSLMPEFDAPAGYKDPEKIAAAIKAKQTKWLEQAALSAVTGEVLCIGFYQTEFDHYDGTERDLIAGFWAVAQGEIQAGNSLVGFCCKMFDLPFLIRRSWKHGLSVPKCIWNGRYFCDQIVDVAEKWECGTRNGDHISLDQLAKFLGIGQKSGNGQNFAALWRDNREQALAYLQNDLALTREAYTRICAA